MTVYSILYFANSAIPSRTANSVHVMKMCEGIGRGGGKVTLLIPDCGMREGGDAFEFYGVSTCFLLKRIKWMKKSPVGILNYLFTLYAGLYIKLIEKPSVVVTRNPIAAVLFPLLRIPTIVEFHKPLESRRVIGRLAAGLDIFRNRHVLKLVVISKSLKEEFIRNGSPGDKIQVLPDAANLPLAFNTPRPDTGRLQVGYVGSLYKGRGIEIIQTMAERDPFCDFWIIGGSPSEISERQSERLPPNLLFRGHVPNREVPEILSEMDVLLMPYQRKVSVSGNTDDTARWMSPMKMFEYMAAGKPIIASDLEVLKEVLVHRENCLLAVPEDAQAWVMALGALKSEPQLAKVLGENARRTVVDNYTWEIRAKRMFQDLLLPMTR